MDVLAVADALFRAVERGDVEAVRRLYDPDVRVWHNFDDQDQTLEENLGTLRWLIENVSERRYEVLRRERLQEGFLQQHVLHGTLRDGAPLRVPAAFVGLVRDGRIIRIEEYLDASALALLGTREAGATAP